MHYPFDDVKKHIVQIFKLNRFEAGGHGSLNAAKDHFTIDRVVNFLWAAQVYYYERPIIVAVMRTETEHKAVLIDSAGKLSKESVIVDLEDWSDPVEQALRSINLAPTDKKSRQSGEFLTILVSTDILSADLYLEIGKQDASLNGLSKAVFETIQKLAALYGGKDWYWFFRTSLHDETFEDEI